MSTEPYLVREILQYSDGSEKIVNFKPLPMSDDEQNVAEPVPEAEAPAAEETPAADAPAEEAAPEESAPAETESA